MLNEQATNTFANTHLASIGWQDCLAEKYLTEQKIPDDESRFGTPITVHTSSFKDEGNVTAVSYIPERLFEAYYNIIRLMDTEVKKETQTMPAAIALSWKQLATAGFSEETYLFIVRLARMKEGWRGVGSRPLDVGSLFNFLKFWNKIEANIAEPEFVLVPNGNIQAEWYKDERHFLELKFMPQKNMVAFGYFDGDTVLEGIIKPNDIISILSLHDFKPLQWTYVG